MSEENNTTDLTVMSVQIVGVNINLHKYGRDVSGKIRKFQGHILNDKTVNMKILV
jgi:hypothetical protein